MFYILHNGDSFEYIKDNIKDNSVDLLLTDIPYIISVENQITTMKDRDGRNGLDFGEWDKSFEVSRLVEFIPKLTKNGSLVVFHSFEQFGELLNIFSEKLSLKDRLIWEKSNPMPRNADRRYIVNIEMASWWTKGDDWVFNRQSNTYDTCVLRYPSESGGAFTRFHPTQKNVDLMSELVRRHSNEGDIVLDPFMGSGSTGVACMLNGRNFIGIEAEKKYYDIAEQRIVAAKCGATPTISKDTVNNKRLF